MSQRRTRPVRPTRTPEAQRLFEELPKRPSEAELRHRQAVVEQILKERETRRIAPLTAADLVHMSRRAEWPFDD